MKHCLIYRISGLLFLLTSCSSNMETKSQANSMPENYKYLDTLVSFSGSWVSENYYNILKNFKSPKLAQEASSSFIVIPHKTLQKTFMVYNFHEGGELLKVIKRDSEYELWEYSDETDSPTKRIFSIEIISDNKIRIDTTVYEKISNVDSYGNDLIIEEILFKGVYRSSNGSKIEFTGDGKITGMDDFNSYEPMIDYIDEGMDVDQVYLRKISKKSDRIEYKFSDRFGFKFSGDTLDLFKLNCVEYDRTSNNCGIVEFGERIDRLIKEGKN